MNVQRRIGGFTLIEVMVVVAIIGILTMIAFPSYQEYVARGRRADAKGALLENAQFLERYYTENSRYVASDNSAVNLPRTASPNSGGVFYNLSYNGDPTKTAYSLKAVPTGAASSDQCATFTLNQLGQKGLIVGGSASTDQEKIANCWNR